MRVDHYPFAQLKRDLLAVMRKHLDLRAYEIFFFGSRVTGTGTDRSDIDVGIDGRTPIPARTWLAMQEEIEALPTMYKIELVDFTRAAPSFRAVAMQKREMKPYICTDWISRRRCMPSSRRHFNYSVNSYVQSKEERLCNMHCG